MRLIYPKKFKIPQNLIIDNEEWEKLAYDYNIETDVGAFNIHGLLVKACKFTGTMFFNEGGNINKYYCNKNGMIRHIK